jgi:hypothetical protein
MCLALLKVLAALEGACALEGARKVGLAGVVMFFSHACVVRDDATDTAAALEVDWWS